MTTNTEKRRAGFEAWFESIPWPMCEKCSKDKDIAWRAWNAALDSVCVELPQGFVDSYGIYYAAGEIEEALATAGIAYK